MNRAIAALISSFCVINVSSANPFDLYEMVGVKATAQPNEIKEAYFKSRQDAGSLSPFEIDCNRDYFEIINTIWDILMDDLLRDAYKVYILQEISEGRRPYSPLGTKTPSKTILEEVQALRVALRSQIHQSSPQILFTPITHGPLSDDEELMFEMDEMLS